MLRLDNPCVKENITVRRLAQLVSAINDDNAKKTVSRSVQEKPYYLRESEEQVMGKFGTNVENHENSCEVFKLSAGHAYNTLAHTKNAHVFAKNEMTVASAALFLIQTSRA